MEEEECCFTCKHWDSKDQVIGECKIDFDTWVDKTCMEEWCEQWESHSC